MSGLRWGAGRAGASDVGAASASGAVRAVALNAERAVARVLRAANYVAFWVRRWLMARRHIRGGGLEIGALHLPLRVSSHARVRYVDRMDVAGLRKYYPELAARKLVPVDVLDDGETLASQADESADFIIANHVIEHTEDPLGSIASCLRVLRPGGVLYLGVPDRRRTFDVDRSPTSLAHLIRDHEDGPSSSRRLHQEEWARFVLKVPPDLVEDRVRELDRKNDSIHYHVWDPSEFQGMLAYARDDAELPFEVKAIRPNGHEFIVVLRRV